MDQNIYTLQVRVADILGDNGMVSVVICRKKEREWIIDTWLMSCRVLGRRVEEVVLRKIAEAAKSCGANDLIGLYIPTERNVIVENHYKKLGFEKESSNDSGCQKWRLNIRSFISPELPFEVEDVI